MNNQKFKVGNVYKLNSSFGDTSLVLWAKNPPSTCAKNYYSTGNVVARFEIFVVLCIHGGDLYVLTEKEKFGLVYGKWANDNFSCFDKLC